MSFPRLFAISVLLLAGWGTSSAQTVPPPSLSLPNGETIVWNDWLADHGSTAVVLWASWLPDDQKMVAGLGEIRRAAADTGLDFVVIALQEPIEASRKALNPTGLDWLHDRHGALLKHLLVYRIPALVVIQRDGTISARLKADPEALRQWKASK